MYDVKYLIAILLTFSFLFANCKSNVKLNYKDPVKEPSTCYCSPIIRNIGDKECGLTPSYILECLSGDEVLFYEVNGEWKAQVKSSFPDGDVMAPMLSILSENNQSISTLLESLAKLDASIHKYSVHQLYTREKQKVIFLGKLGLRGGMEGDIEEIRNFYINRVAFFDAIREGNLELVQQFLDNGMYIGVDILSDRQTALHKACMAGHVNLAKLFIAKGSKLYINLADKDGLTPLDLATINGHLEVVDLLIDECPYLINQHNKFNSTGLHLAVNNGHLEIAKLLLEKGAKPNVPDEDGDTPLHIAANNGYLELAKLLIEKSASINLTNGEGYTPLHIAAYNGDLEIVKLLIGEGDGINLTDREGNTALHLAACGHLEIVKLLLEKGAYIMSNDKGNTPFHLSAYNGHLGVIELLLNNEAQINKQNYNGNTFLHILAYSQRIDVLLEFIEHDIFNYNLNCLYKIEKQLINSCLIKDILSIVVDYLQGVNWNLSNNKGRTVREILEEEQLKFNDPRFNKAINLIKECEVTGGWYKNNKVLGVRKKLDEDDVNVNIHSDDEVQNAVRTKIARHDY